MATPLELFDQIKMKPRKITSQHLEYKNFVELGSLGRLRHLRERIVQLELHRLNKSINRNNLNESLVKIQYLFDSLLAKKVFLGSESGKKLSLPLPVYWMKSFSEFGFAINYWRSRILFLLFLLKKALIETGKSFYYLQYIFKNSSYSELKTRESILFHSSFNDKHIFASDDGMMNFGNWYSIRYHPNHELLYLNNCDKFSTQNIRYKTMYVKNYLFPMDIRSYSSFLIKSLLFIILNFLDYNYIRNLRFISLSDEILRLRFENLNKQILPNTVLLSESSGYIYPSWLKFLEQNGVRIQVFNFSSSDNPSLKNESFDFRYPWSMLQWTEVNVIDSYQKVSLARKLGNNSARIEVVGVPFYTDLQHKLTPDLRYISLFDIMCSPEHFGISTLNEVGANNLQIQQEILEMVVEYGLMKNIKIYYKQKRTSNLQVFGAQTIDRIKEAQHQELFEILDSRISTHRLIKGASAVISQAFTTTSLIAKEFNKPSFVVDLSNNLLESDPCLRGLPVINSKSELYKSLDLLFDVRNPEVKI